MKGWGAHGRAHRRRGWDQREFPSVHPAIFGSLTSPTLRRARRPPSPCPVRRRAWSWIARARLSLWPTAPATPSRSMTSPIRRRRARTGSATLTFKGIGAISFYGGLRACRPSQRGQRRASRPDRRQQSGESDKSTRRPSLESSDVTLVWLDRGHLRALRSIPTPFRSPKPAIFLSWPRRCAVTEREPLGRIRRSVHV